MKVSVQDGKSCEKVLSIEVPREEIQKEYDEFYKAVMPKAKIPGFRPGKAPRNVVAMHYGHDAREHVLKNLISESFKSAIREKAIEPLGMPKIDDVKFDDNRLTFKAMVEVRPKIKLSRVEGLNAKKESAEVKDADIEESLKKMQESLAQYKPVEGRSAAMGDFVIADYVCTSEGKEIEKRNDDWFEIKEDEFLKGFSPQLVGLNAGDEKEIEIHFPEKMARKELSGKKAVFKVKVKEIKTKILPELNDDLAKEAGEFKTLEEVKQKIHKDMMDAKTREKEAEFENALLEELLKHNRFDLPQGLVERRLQYLLRQAQENFQRHGAPAGEFEKQKEKLQTEILPEARRQVQLAFLLDEIAEREKITVAAEDLKEKYQQVADRIRQPMEVVEKYYADHEEAREGLEDQVRNEKTVEFLKKNAKVK